MSSILGSLCLNSSSVLGLACASSFCFGPSLCRRFLRQGLFCTCLQSLVSLFEFLVSWALLLQVPSVLGPLCVDVTLCFYTCGANVYTHRVIARPSLPYPLGGMILVLPTAALPTEGNSPAKGLYRKVASTRPLEPPLKKQAAETTFHANLCVVFAAFLGSLL